jgi:death-on-curing protein
LTWNYLDLGDFLVFAEEVLGVPAQGLARLKRLAGADSALHAPRGVWFGEEQYPDFEMKAAVLCVRLIRNHPLPDGNKRVAFLCMNEFIERNGFELVFDDPDEMIQVLLAVATGEMDEEALAVWISPRLRRLAT